MMVCNYFFEIYCLNALLGHYVKDLTVLNNDISQTIIVDNSPMSYIFQPGMFCLVSMLLFFLFDVENAIDCTSFFDDPTDIELWQVCL
jgi:RNA polymerase II subunit A small phosphatase-like protein